METLLEKSSLIGKPLRVRSPSNRDFYQVDTYKNESIKSVDWSKFKNPFIKPEEKKKEFVKIDYLKMMKRREKPKIEDPFEKVNQIF
jgi:hypothetical protein